MRVARITTNPNPVGTPYYEVLANEVRKYVDQWNATVSTGKKPGWNAAVAFVIDAIDDFIVFVDDQITTGADKKATVLAALMSLYDNIVTPLLPLWLRPFSGQIKTFIFSIVISTLIDFIVNKYRTGYWVPPTTNPAPTDPVPAS